MRDRGYRQSTVGAWLDVLDGYCPGCGADTGERCREWCLSMVTDDTGQAVDRDDTAGGD